MRAPKAWVLNGVLIVAADYHQREICKSIPGAQYTPADKTWRWLASPSTAMQLHLGFGRVQGDQAFRDLLAAAQAVVDAGRYKTAGDLPPVPLFKNQPWQHQAAAFWFIVELFGGLPKESR